MILVDIHVPSTGRTYDFNLDENVPVSILLDEISEMIAQIEKIPNAANAKDLMLCSYDSNTIFDPRFTLYENHASNGSRLFLV